MSVKKTREPLKVINVISFNGPDGEYKPLEKCTPSELQLFRDTVGKRVSGYLSEAYSNNPEKFISADTA